MNEVRPCLVGKKNLKALWHKWVDKSEIVPPSLLRGGHGGGVVKDTFALVEYENGLVRLVQATDVYFLDSAQKFNEYYYPEPTEEE